MDEKLEGVRYRHVRLPWVGRNAAVTAAVMDWPISYGTGKLVAVAFSFCSPEDMFDRRFGRERATGRLRPEVGRDYHVRVLGRGKVDDDVFAALSKLCNHGKLPFWMTAWYDGAPLKHHRNPGKFFVRRLWERIKVRFVKDEEKNSEEMWPVQELEGSQGS